MEAIPQVQEKLMDDIQDPSNIYSGLDDKLDDYKRDTFGSYLYDIGQIPLLKLAEEKDLVISLGKERSKLDLIIYGNESFVRDLIIHNVGNKNSKKSNFHRENRDGRTINEILTDLKLDAIDPEDIDDFYELFRTRTITELQGELNGYHEAIINEDYNAIEAFQESIGIAQADVPKYNIILDYIKDNSAINDNFKIKVREQFSKLLEDYSRTVKYGIRVGERSIEDFATLTGITPGNILDYKIEYDKVDAEFSKVKDDLTNPNLRLVVSIAKKYYNGSFPLLDLIQDGNMGLMKSFDRYQPELGYKVSTYATWWIKQSIRRGIDDKISIVRVPVHSSGLIRKLLNAANDLEINLDGVSGNELDQLASKMKKFFHVIDPKTKVIDLIDAYKISRIISLDYSSYEDADPLSYFIESDDPSPQDEAEKNITRIDIISVIEDILTERESSILFLRHGLVDGEKKTLEEVGRKFGVTRERIRQIEANAMRKIRTGAPELSNLI